MVRLHERLCSQKREQVLSYKNVKLKSKKVLKKFTYANPINSSLYFKLSPNSSFIAEKPIHNRSHDRLRNSGLWSYGGSQISSYHLSFSRYSTPVKLASRLVHRSPPYFPPPLFFPLKIYTLFGDINNDLVKNFMQHLRNGLLTHLTNSFTYNIC